MKKRAFALLTALALVGAPAVPAIALNSPQLNSPKLNSPKLNSPKLNSPKLNSPKLNSPKLNSPKLNAPQLTATGSGNDVASGTEGSNGATSGDQVVSFGATNTIASNVVKTQSVVDAATGVILSPASGAPNLATIGALTTLAVAGAVGSGVALVKASRKE